MAGRLRGRSSSGVELVRMYHYSPNVIRDAVKQFSKWTDIGFGGKSIQAVARITGLQLDKIKYRYELILPREDRERYFRNIATKMLPGLGAASEYISQIPIPINWIQQVIKMSKP